MYSKLLTYSYHNVDTSCINTNQSDTMEINDTITIISENNCPKPIKNYDILDLDNAINTYHMSAVKFTLSLLDNKHFSRKDVFEIQRKIEKYIIKPVENLISSVALSKHLSLYEQLINISNDQTQIKHFIQGELKEKTILPYQNKIVIPYFIYIDDFEINNPLGPHVSVHSISAIYYSFPLTNQSKLLMCQINDFEVNGIIIDTPCGTRGDDLGFNSICELSRSFSANFFCSLLLRNPLNYADDVRKQYFNYGPIEVGKKSPILKLANIKKFHLKMSAREMMIFSNIERPLHLYIEAKVESILQFLFEVLNTA
ncbi:Uncharacterized protein FWK35_00014952 [Aphis craccivora]|uniref:Uncharacterized protein n=1 Tax=Aphis craccivora TaxID=307492 RepID=A0A6G0XS15_APHCR|nr:Uncharacterized protein FWK35_00014952 [Aphis craccivora]